MKDYSREQEYQLPIKPSPNLPNIKSINLYPSLCLFEGTNVSVGRGTDIPFQQFGSPFLKGTYNFVPKSKKGSKNPKHKDLKCYGTNLQYLDIHLNGDSIITPDILLEEVKIHYGEMCSKVLREMFIEVSLHNGLHIYDTDIDN